MKTSKFIIDSSVFVSLLNSGDANHESSKDFMELVVYYRVKILLPVIVLFEVFHTLNKIGFLEDPHAYEKFHEFFNYECFDHLDLDIDFFKLFRELNFFGRLKTSDAIIASFSLLTDSALVSWDKKLVENSFNAYTPEEFLS